MDRQQAQDFRLQPQALSTDYVTFSLKVPPCHHHYHQHQEAAGTEEVLVSTVCLDKGSYYAQN